MESLREMLWVTIPQVLEELSELILTISIAKQSYATVKYIEMARLKGKNVSLRYRTLGRRM
jgi:hypothetical protein